MRGTGHTLSREQVMKTERRAWAGHDRDGRKEYSFDGINFWIHRGRTEAELIAPWRAPVTGWRHRNGCVCPECISRAVAS
jgi:hypothetical protein